MKLDRLLPALSVFALVAGSFTAAASADLIVELTGLDLNNDFFVNGVRVGAAGTASAPVGTASANFAYTVTGLNVAGDSSANDTVVFSFDVAATNGVIDNLNAYSMGVDGPGNQQDDGEVDLGEALTFSNLDAMVTLGNPTTDTVVIASANFTRFTSRFPGGGDVVAVTDGSGGTITPSATPDGGFNDPYDFPSPEPEFMVASGGGNGFGVDEIGATFDLRLVSVPEPSSLALFSLASFGLLARRRK